MSDPKIEFFQKRVVTPKFSLKTTSIKPTHNFLPGLNRKAIYEINYYSKLDLE